jgi:hypothetical protein
MIPSVDVFLYTASNMIPSVDVFVYTASKMM